LAFEAFRDSATFQFNVTDHLTAEWVVQQLREAPEAAPYRYAIFDRDSTFK